MTRHALCSLGLVLTLAAPAFAQDPGSPEVPPRPGPASPRELRRGAIMWGALPSVAVAMDPQNEGALGFQILGTAELYKFLPIIDPYAFLGARWGPPGFEALVGGGVRPMFPIQGTQMDVYLDGGLMFSLGEQRATWRVGGGWHIWVTESFALGMSVLYNSDLSFGAPVSIDVGLGVLWNVGSSQDAASKPRRR